MVDHYHLRTGQPVKYLTQVKAVAARQTAGAAEALRDDKSWRTIAELGIGVNPNIKHVTGVQLIDEKMYGTLHIAIGHNLGYGGRTNFPSVHCDMTTLKPLLIIDGMTILEDGQHVYNIKAFEKTCRGELAADAAQWMNPEAFVGINDERYRDDPSEGFLVRRVTGSGRETLYPILDGYSTEITRRLILAIGAFRRKTVDELRCELKLGETEFANLIAILHCHKVVSE
jgi:hypothetical protein